MRRRLPSPFWLLFIAPLYVGVRLVPALTTSASGAFLATLLLGGACILIRSSIRRTDRLAWIGLTLMGFFATLFVMCILRDVFLLAARVMLDATSYARLPGPSARIAIAIAALMTVIGFIFARRPRLIEVDIPVRALPRSLEGFSIAQISDVHVGATIRRGFVERLVERVNALHADLIAVTGDLVDGPVEALSTHTAPLARLAARHGAYFVTGNHEYYSGERAWTSELRRLGLKVLKNEHVVLEHEGASLVLAGVTDISAHRFDASERSDPVTALRGAPVDAGARILLAHQPGSADAAARAGFDVQISGHTHGGQFWPWNHFIRFFQPFTAGLHRLKDLWVYVSRGTGYWGPPNRFGVPSEITRIRLVAARS